MTAVIIPSVRLLGTGPILDVEIRDGRIAGFSPARESTPDTNERVLLPGLVDLHTHLREPGFDESETIASGTAAAAAGGYTDVFAMPNTNPVTDTVERVENMRALASGAPAEVHVIGALSIGERGEELVDYEALAAAGVTLFSDDGHCLERSDLVLESMTRLAKLDGVFAQHSQNTAIVGNGVVDESIAELIDAVGWPMVGEETVVAHDVAIARATGAHLHVCHLSTAGTIEILRWAKSIGVHVTGEATPHHLALTATDAQTTGPALKVNPPLRAAENGAALRAALADGTIDVVGTDHAPHPAANKCLPWDQAAFGLTGLETALAVTAWSLTGTDGVVNWNRVIEVLSTTPRLIGKLPAADLSVGAPASFCVVENSPFTVDASTQLSRSSNTGFSGRTLGHRVVFTMNRGRQTYGATKP